MKPTPCGFRAVVSSEADGAAHVLTLDCGHQKRGWTVPQKSHCDGIGWQEKAPREPKPIGDPSPELLAALTAAKGVCARAAKLLGCSREWVRQLVKRHGLADFCAGMRSGGAS